MKSRLFQLGMAVALGVLVTVFALLLVMPAQARPLLAGGTLLSEGFENTVFPPANWQLNVITGTSTYTWTRVSSGSNPFAAPHGGGWMAHYYSYLAPSGFATRLATPVLDFSSLTSPALEFWMFHGAGSGADRIQVELSTNGGINYTIVLTTVNRNDGSSGWKQHTVDLSPYIGQTNVRLGFLGISAYGYNIYLDDVSVGDPAPSDVAQKSVAPAGTRYTGEVVTYTVIFTNTGDLTGTATLNDPIPAGAQVVPDSVTGGAVYSDALNAVVWSPINLAPDNSVTTTFRVTLTAINGTVTNTATISDDTIFAPVSASAANAIAVADFSASTMTTERQYPSDRIGDLHRRSVQQRGGHHRHRHHDGSHSRGCRVSARLGQRARRWNVAGRYHRHYVDGHVTGGQRVTVTFGVSLTALTGNVINTAYINSPNINATVTKAASVAVQPYSGGPDLFGYTYKDSLRPGRTWLHLGRTFDHEQVDHVGRWRYQRWLLRGESALPVCFLYQHLHSGLPQHQWFGQPLVRVRRPTPMSPSRLRQFPTTFAACYWDDLRIWSTNPITEGVYYEVQGTAPNRVAILTFSLEDTYYASGAMPPYRFQMVLSEGTNQITCQYQQMTSAAPRGTGQSATMGLENAAGTEGLLYFYGSGTTFPAPMEDHLAIRYTPPQRPNYAVAKTAQPIGLVYPGQVLTYSLTITNFGALIGTATISDPLPAGVVFVGPVPGDPLQPAFDGYAVTWTGPVPNGQSVTVRFLAGVLPSLSGWITNTATISDSLIPTVLTAQTSNTVARPIYTTSSKVVIPSGVVNPGQLLTYTVSIVNSGQLSSTASLIDAVSAGTTYVPGSAAIVSGGGSIVADSDDHHLDRHRDERCDHSSAVECYRLRQLRRHHQHRDNHRRGDCGAGDRVRHQHDRLTPLERVYQDCQSCNCPSGRRTHLHRPDQEYGHAHLNRCQSDRRTAAASHARSGLAKRFFRRGDGYGLIR